MEKFLVDDKSVEPRTFQTQVACYWFGFYHNDSRWERELGRPFTEWELVRKTKPLFSGHKQPKIPLLGYRFDDDQKKIQEDLDLAKSHGIDAFIVDWYWYDGPFLDAPLKHFCTSEGGAKFSLMWANHDWVDVFPAPPDTPPRVVFNSSINEAEFEKVADRLIEEFFSSSSYWAPFGGPYFSIFRPHQLIRNLGGIVESRRIIEAFRNKVAAAGLGRLHIAAVTTHMEAEGLDWTILGSAGFDSATDYNWINYLGQESRISYSDWSKNSLRAMQENLRSSPVPFAPNVTVGWDCTPRTVPGPATRFGEWPYLPVVIGPDKKELAHAMGRALRLAEHHHSPGYITLNAWNEWTEGCFLEPDDHDAWAKLEAIKDATFMQRNVSTVRKEV